MVVQKFAATASPSSPEGAAVPKPAMVGSQKKPQLVRPSRDQISSREHAASKVGTRKKNSQEKPNAQNSRLALLEGLLSYESQVRKAQSIRELIYCLANETLQITHGQQVFILRSKRRKSGSFFIDTVSNLSSIDRNSSSLVALEKDFNNAAIAALARPVESRITPYCFQLVLPNAVGDGKKALKNAVFLPLTGNREKAFSALVVLSNNASFESEIPVLSRVKDVAQHAWLALEPKPRFGFSAARKKLFGSLLFLIALAVLFIPVPLSTLAPVEIVAREPQIVAAPIDGVISEILVEPNSPIIAGTPLFRYVDTVMASNLKVAEQKWSVASARLQTARQNSFGSGEGRRDLAITDAELQLATAELEFAQAQFSKTIVVSPSDGLAVLGRKSKWQGKPVSVGERILEIADATNVEARIDLAVSDAIVIREKSRVQLFLDTNPLTPIDAQIETAGYRASMDESNQLSFKVFARLSDSDNSIPRIGARGTAQLFGDEVSLGFYLFRRPLSAIRQTVGW